MIGLATCANSATCSTARFTSPAAGGEREIRLVDLPVSPGSISGNQPSAANAGYPAFDSEKSYREIRSDFESEFERRYVAWLLDRHSGNISAAAREAKMDRKHLYDLARKRGLRGDSLGACPAPTLVSEPEVPLQCAAFRVVNSAPCELRCWVAIAPLFLSGAASQQLACTGA